MPKLRMFHPRKKANETLPVIQECSEERIEEGDSSSSSEDSSSYVDDLIVHSNSAEIFHRFVTRKCLLLNLVAFACISCIIAVTIQLEPYDIAQSKKAAETRVSKLLKRVESLVASEFDFRDDKNEFQTSIISNHFQDRHLEKIKLPIYGEEPYSFSKDPIGNAQPVFWIANSRSSGTSAALKDILTYCMNLVISSDAEYSGKEGKTEVLVFNTADNLGHFANANTETREGIIRANTIGVVESEIVHVISTPYLAEASDLFRGKQRTGRIFALLQNPVDQAYSDFLQRKSLPGTDEYYIAADVTIGTHAQNQKGISNPLTRVLLNATDDEILDYDKVLIAKRMLFERVLVGLVENFFESVHMFSTYFGWDLQNHACITNFESAIHISNGEAEPLAESDRRHLANWHSADMELYELGKTMFEHRLKLSVSTASTHV